LCHRRHVATCWRHFQLSHRPLSSLVVSPPLLLRRVVPHPRRHGCLCSRSEGTAASSHPSASSRRRGKIPPVIVVLCSDEDASRRPPPPPSSRVVHRPHPAQRHSHRRHHRVLLHPVSAFIAPSNTCSCSRQRDIIAAPRRRRRPSPQPPPRRPTPKLLENKQGPDLRK
jgi:hypothetical protein